MTEQVERSTWQSKFAAMGPGILMASAAVGALILLPLLRREQFMAGN